MGTEIMVKLKNGEDVFLMNISPDILTWLIENDDNNGKDATLQAHLYTEDGLKFFDVPIRDIIGVSSTEIE